MKKKILLLIGIIMILGASGCAEVSGTDEKAGVQVVTGEELLKAHCIECHSMSRITGIRLSQEDWTVVVDRMLKKDISHTLARAKSHSLF